MKRTKVNLSNYKLATADMGQLVPVQCQEILPGDTMRLSTSALIRMSPMMAPVMHPVQVRFHHWFVPARLLWDKWEDFITGGKDNANADTIPKHQLSSTPENGVLDYMGVPPVQGLEVNALPLRAYNMIYNEFYRDQDLQGERDLEDNSLAHVSWRKDYFTAARPWPQKGSDLVLPIGTEAPVIPELGEDSLVWLKNPDNPSAYNGMSKTTSTMSFSSSSNTSDGTHVPALVADLSHATGVTATEFREFFALQRYAEARARYGSRYTEYLRYLGIKPSDARLQRPEYLGGGKSTLQFSEVLQTAEGTNPVATMRGHGITGIKTKNTRRFFEEHGYVITLMSVIPKSIYQDGAPRMWFKHDKEHFFQKELQNIGQQKVLQGEVYAKQLGQEMETFGFTDRYSEYTSTPSSVAGEFRKDLDYWHLARKFADVPRLNSDFITCKPSKRIFAEQTKHSLWCMINNSVVARRMVKKTSVGKLL